MPTQAISAYGIELRLSDGTTPAVLNISNATNATPIVITTTAPHGIADVSRVSVQNVAGNTAANGEWVAAFVTTTTLRLRGSVGNAAYTGGGTLQKHGVFAEIAEVTNLEDAGATCTLIEVSAHDGPGWTSRIPSLLDDMAIRLSLNFVPNHPTHNAATGLEHLLLNRIPRDYLLVFPDVAKTTWAMFGYVTQHQVQAPVAGALTSTTTITMDGKPLLA